MFLSGQSIENKRTLECLYAKCADVSKNCWYVEWQWKVE